MESHAHVRILRAILIGPAVVPIGAFVFALASGFRMRESAMVAAVYGLFSYGGIVILGLPAYFALERTGSTSLWHYLFAGATLGALVAVLFTMIVEGIAVPGAAAVLVFGSSGATVAAAFWAIAVRRGGSANARAD